MDGDQAQSEGLNKIAAELARLRGVLTPERMTTAGSIRQMFSGESLEEARERERVEREEQQARQYRLVVIFAAVSAAASVASVVVAVLNAI